MNERLLKGVTTGNTMEEIKSSCEGSYMKIVLKVKKPQ